MVLDSLTLSNFRNIGSADILFSPGLNYFVGENGAGKTSVLEAINLYWNGRSFRSTRLSKLINEEHEEAFVNGKVVTTDDGRGEQPGSFGLSISDRKKSKLVKYNGEIVRRSSDLAKLFPVFYYSPTSVSIVSGSPSERRKLLNWFMFHVEPKFHDYYQKVKLAVESRNKLLRITPVQLLSKNSEFDYWEDQIDQASRKIVALIDSHIGRLNEHFSDLIHQLDSKNESVSQVFNEVSISIDSGWRDFSTPLKQQLINKRFVEKKGGFSTVGFHRSDIVLRDGTQKRISDLSRGEEKSIGLMLILSMLSLMKSYKISVLLLIDDLHSELDFQNAKFIVSAINKLGFQSLITCIDSSFICRINEEHNYKLFHVKQGNICEDN